MTQRSNSSTQLPNTYLRQFFRYLGGRDELLRDTLETSDSLAALGGSNSYRDYCQFFRNAREVLGAPDVGLVLGRVNQLANMHGPLSAALYQSVDIQDCLELLQRFVPLRLPAVRINWIEDKDNIGLQINFSESAGNVHASVTETLLLSATNIIAVVSQDNVYPSRIELDYPRPDYAARYHDAFKVPSFCFSRPHIRMLVSRKDASYCTETDPDLSLRASAVKRCEELLHGALQLQTTNDRIKQIFADNPGHLWLLKDVARHLNMSVRTLQRRLNSEGTSYQKLHNEWLMREAHLFLGERNLSIESIAFLLGYSDVSNFRQSCRRWYGVSPQTYRELRRNNAAALRLGEIEDSPVTLSG